MLNSLRFLLWQKSFDEYSTIWFVFAKLLYILVPPLPPQNSPSVLFERLSPGLRSVSHSVMSEPLPHHGLESASLLCPRNSARKNTGVGRHSLLQGILLTQGSNPGLPYSRQILYLLSHQGNQSVRIPNKQIRTNASHSSTWEPTNQILAEKAKWIAVCHLFL